MLLALTLALAQQAAPLAPDPLARFDRVERRTTRDRGGAHHARWVSGGGYSMSSDPLLAPPELRLTGEPLRLPSVRAGGIELEVETDVGVVVRTTRRVAEGERVRIVVPR